MSCAQSLDSPRPWFDMLGMFRPVNLVDITEPVLRAAYVVRAEPEFSKRMFRPCKFSQLRTCSQHPTVLKNKWENLH